MLINHWTNVWLSLVAYTHYYPLLEWNNNSSGMRAIAGTMLGQHWEHRLNNNIILRRDLGPVQTLDINYHYLTWSQVSNAIGFHECDAHSHL